MRRYPEDVFSLHYMNKLQFYLNSIADWPVNVLGASNVTYTISTIYRCILITLMCFDIYSTIAYSKKHTDTDLGQTYLNCMLSSVYLQRLFLPFQEKFCLLMKKFIFEFHLIHHKHKTDFAKQVYHRVNKICSVISVISRSQVVSAVILYNVIPLYKNFNAGMFAKHKPKNGTFVHSIDYDLPFDQYTTYRGYFIVFILNVYNSYNVAVGICMNDFLIFTIVFHIWGHLNILIHDLKYLTHPSYQHLESSGHVTQEDIFNRLKDIIKHHQMIKEFMSRTSEAFSISLFCYLIFHQLSGCVLLLKSSSLELTDLSRYGLITFIVFQQLIETSVIFELIRSKGDILADKVYELPWERMDTRNRGIVMMFLNNVQTSLGLKAGGMVPIGVMTMSTIIKTSCSYFIMLRTVTHT